MSCHWLRRAASLPWIADDVEATYVDLVRSGRKGDFYWLARSQGLTAEEIDRLWDRLWRQTPARLRRPD